MVAELATAGCGAAVVYSSGFAETGPDGAARQRELVDAAGPMTLLGPNCYGLINYADGALIWPDQHGGVPLRPGERGVAVVSQSSSIAISVTMTDIGLPLGYVITVGNGAQTSVARAAAALLADERVSAIGLILETLADVRGLERLAALARDRGVGVVALVLGRGEPARRAVQHAHRLAGRGRGGRVERSCAASGSARSPPSTRCSARCACCTAAGRCRTPGWARSAPRAGRPP